MHRRPCSAVGPKGANVRRVESETGARVSCEPDRTTVAIAGAAGYAKWRGGEPWSIGYDWAGAAAPWLALLVFLGLAGGFWVLATRRTD